MCDRPEAFNTKTRKARNEHKCCECDVTIKKGDKYQYSSGIWMESLWPISDLRPAHKALE